MATRSDVRAGSASVAILTDDSRLRRGLAAAVAKLRSFGDEARAVMDQAGSGGARTALLGAGWTAGLVAVAKNFADVGAAQGRLQDQTGLSARALSGLVRIAADNDLATTSLARSLTFLQRMIAKGGDEAERSFARLGTSVAEVRRMRLEQVLALIANQLPKITDENERALLATELFGKSGQELLPIFRDGAGALNEAADAAGRAGDAFTDDALAAASSLDDGFDLLSASVKGLRNSVAQALEPAIQTLVTSVAGAVQRVSAWISKNPELTRSVLGLSLGVTALGGAVFAAGTTASAGIALVSVATTALGTVFGLLTVESGAAAAGMGGAAVAATAQGVAATGAAAATGLLAAATGALAAILIPLGIGAVLLAVALAAVVVGLGLVTDYSREAAASLGIVETGFGDLFNSIRFGGRGLATWFETLWTFILEGWERTWFGIATGADFLWTSIKGLATGFYDAVIAPIVDMFDPILEGIGELVSSVFGWIGDGISWLWKKVAALASALPGSAGKLIGDELNRAEDDGDSRTQNFTQRLRARAESTSKSINVARARQVKALLDDPDDGTRFSFNADLAAKGLSQVGDSITRGMAALIDRFLPNVKNDGSGEDGSGGTSPFNDEPGREIGPAAADEDKKSKPEKAQKATGPQVDVLGTFNADVADRIGFGTGLQERQTRAAEQTAANTAGLVDAIRAVADAVRANPSQAGGVVEALKAAIRERVAAGDTTGGIGLLKATLGEALRSVASGAGGLADVERLLAAPAPRGAPAASSSPLVDELTRALSTFARELPDLEVPELAGEDRAAPDRRFEEVVALALRGQRRETEPARPSAPSVEVDAVAGPATEARAPVQDALQVAAPRAPDSPAGRDEALLRVAVETARASVETAANTRAIAQGMSGLAAATGLPVPATENRQARGVPLADGPAPTAAASAGPASPEPATPPSAEALDPFASNFSVALERALARMDFDQALPDRTSFAAVVRPRVEQTAQIATQGAQDSVRSLDAVTRFAGGQPARIEGRGEDRTASDEQQTRAAIETARNTRALLDAFLRGDGGGSFQ